MSTSYETKNLMKATDLQLNSDTLTVDLEDGRTISAPLAWYPRLVHATAQERNNWRWIADGEGVHWSDLDEDISIQNIVNGHSSGESQESFSRWLASRSS